MAYARARGDQVLIVHGVRNPETRAVEQRILYTFYSRAEASEFVEGATERVERQLEHEYPEIRFDWDGLRERLAELAPGLPEGDEAADVVRAGLRDDLAGIARVLGTLDPSLYTGASELVAAHRGELRFVRDLVDATLAAGAGKCAGVDGLGRLGRSAEPSLLAQELAESYEDRGEPGMTRSAIAFLTAAYPGWIDGHIALGDRALDDGDGEAAAQHYQRAAELAAGSARRNGRRGATGIHRKSLRRALGGLGVAQLQLGHCKKALDIAERLAVESKNTIDADLVRAPAWLGLGRWRLAFDAAKRLVEVYPEQSILVAIAAAHAGYDDEARVFGVRAALTAPLATRVLIGAKTGRVEAGEAARDVRLGLHMRAELKAYLAGSTTGLRRLRETASHPVIARHVAEVLDFRAKHTADPAEHSVIFKRTQELRSAAFAESLAAQCFGTSTTAARPEMLH